MIKLEEARLLRRSCQETGPTFVERQQLTSRKRVRWKADLPVNSPVHVERLKCEDFKAPSSALEP